VIRRFQFRLQSILRHRARVLDLKRRALAEVEAALARERRRLNDALALRDEALGELGRLQAAGMSGGDREVFQVWLDWAGGEIERERRLIAELEALRDAKRAETVRAHQDHEVVDRLKARRREAWRIETARAEQGELDEIAAAAFARASREV
jgi:flagellar export protein FliJ